VGKGEGLCATYGVPLVRHTDLIAVARRSCKALKKEIERDIEIIRQARNSAMKAGKTPGRSPSRLDASSSRLLPTSSARTSSPSKILPIKSVLHTPGTTRVLPAQRSIFKRAADDDGLADETPSKRKRMMTGGYKTPHTPAPEEIYKDILPFRAPDVLQPDHEPGQGDNADSDAEMSDSASAAARSEAEVEAAVIPPRLSSQAEASPSRSRRLAYQKKPLASIIARAASDGVDVDGDGDRDLEVEVEGQEPAEESEPEDDTLPPVRRYRPVLADRAQWRARAPHVEALWEQAEKDLKAWVAKYGQPFESLRAQAVR
jgi:hypothetical protein